MKELRTADRHRLAACLLMALIGLPVACNKDSVLERPGVDCGYKVSSPSMLRLNLDEPREGPVSVKLIIGKKPPCENLPNVTWRVKNFSRFLKSATVAPESTIPATLTVQAMSESEAVANLEQGPTTWATQTGVSLGHVFVHVKEVESGIAFDGGSTQVNVVIDPDAAADEARIEPAPDAVISFPSALQFDTQSRSSRPLCIGNRGRSNLRVDALSISSSDFQLSKDHRNALPLRIPKGRTTCLTVDFRPTNAGSSQADIRITSNDPATPMATIRLEGTPNE